MATDNDTPERYLDGCPSCMTRDNAPHTIERPNQNTANGHYVCRSCGQDWQCSWWQAVAANA